MNVLITLPKKLIDRIVSGDKLIEMRKVFPRHMKVGEDGFFVVEKGTKNVVCWCRVDYVENVIMTERIAEKYWRYLCVSHEFIINYAPLGTKVFLWKIGKVIRLNDLSRESLYVDRNPQSFAYCPLSYGESF